MVQSVRTKSAQPKVLVVDDTEFAELLSIALNRAGYNVITAGSLSEAIGLWSDDVELLITGYQAPASQFQQLESRISNRKPAGKIILTASPTEQPIAGKMKIDSHYHILRKPFDLQSLYTLVRTLVCPSVAVQP